MPCTRRKASLRGGVNVDDIQATLDMLADAGDIENPKPAEEFFTNSLLSN